ncbi:hypothetical protein RHGRI_016677 [Rhododendron griersonianum]|nr:hypothetical protein RHGRI_016677 [Rhododendron griersonianum]
MKSGFIEGEENANTTFIAVLWTKGKLNAFEYAFESLKLSQLVVNQIKKNLLENWLAEDKLECSEELGDLVKHYSELQDIKRVIVSTYATEPQSLVEFFGTLSKEWALGCMKDLLLVNLRGNLQIIVQPCSEDPDIHFKYIESAAKIGQNKEVERVIRELNFYDAEKTENFLMEAKLLMHDHLSMVTQEMLHLWLDDECTEDFIKGLILSVRSLLPVEPP